VQRKNSSRYENRGKNNRNSIIYPSKEILVRQKLNPYVHASSFSPRKKNGRNAQGKTVSIEYNGTRVLNRESRRLRYAKKQLL
jgi:hypothetical protein